MALGSAETVEVADGYLLPAADSEGFEAVKSPGRGSVDLDLFECPGASLMRAIEQRFEAVAALLGAQSVSLD